MEVSLHVKAGVGGGVGEALVLLLLRLAMCALLINCGENSCVG